MACVADSDVCVSVQLPCGRVEMLSATRDTQLSALAARMHELVGVPVEHQEWTHASTGAHLPIPLAGDDMTLESVGVSMGDMLLFSGGEHGMARVSFTHVGTRVPSCYTLGMHLLRLSNDTTLADAAALMRDRTGIALDHQEWYLDDSDVPLEPFAVRAEDAGAGAAAEDVRASPTLRSLGVLCGARLRVSIEEPWPARVHCPLRDIAVRIVVKRSTTLGAVKAYIGAEVARDIVVLRDGAIKTNDAHTMLEIGVVRDDPITLATAPATDPFIVVQCAQMMRAYAKVQYDPDTTTLADMHAAVFAKTGIAPQYQDYQDSATGRRIPALGVCDELDPTIATLGALGVEPRELIYVVDTSVPPPLHAE